MTKRLTELKRAYKQKSAEEGIKISYLRNKNALKYETIKGNTPIQNEKFCVVSEAETEDGILKMKNFEFETHGAIYKDNLNSTRRIIDFWVEYAKIYDIETIYFELKKSSSNNKGGWGNEVRILEALSCGFNVNNVSLNQYGREDVFFMEMNVNEYSIYDLMGRTHLISMR